MFKNLDTLLLLILSFFLIKMNGRIDFSIYNFNNLFLFYINSILGFIIIYRLSILIGKYSEVVKNFFIWLGKNSLNIFLFHPFFLSIVPYILIANLNQKEVYNKPEYLILIYVVIFCTKQSKRKKKKSVGSFRLMPNNLYY